MLAMRAAILFLFISSVWAQINTYHCEGGVSAANSGTSSVISFANAGINTVMNERAIEIEANKPHLDHCVTIDQYGCLYKRKYLVDPDADTLVIYLRGHWKYSGSVPTSQRRASLNEVISTYELHKTYEKLKTPMLISSSSHVGFTVKEIEAAIEAAGLPEDTKVILAAHSGGYHGLTKTLTYLKGATYKFKIVKITMLDNFYFGYTTTSLIKEFVDQGAECNGFLTAHNEARYENRFKPHLSDEICPIQEKKNHYTAVNKCLESYVKDNICYYDPN